MVMKSWKEHLSYKQQEAVITTITILIFLTLGTFFVDTAEIYDIYTIPSPPYSIPGIIGGIGAAASVLVSILLLYVYNKQREILSEQKSLTEYQQTSLLKIEDQELIDYQESKNYQDNQHSSGRSVENLVLYQTEYQEINISNIGLAPAHDLRVELLISTGDERYSANLPLFAGNWENVISQLHSNNRSTLFLNSDGNGIASDSEDKTFTVPLTVISENIPEKWKKPYDLHRWPPANGVVRVADEYGEGEITVSLMLWYTDGRGPQGPHYLRSVEIESDEFLFAKEAVKKDGTEYADGADLKEILDTGTAAHEDRIPDVEHPDVR